MRYGSARSALPRKAGHADCRGPERQGLFRLNFFAFTWRRRSRPAYALMAGSPRSRRFAGLPERCPRELRRKPAEPRFRQRASRPARAEGQRPSGHDRHAGIVRQHQARGGAAARSRSSRPSSIGRGRSCATHRCAGDADHRVDQSNRANGQADERARSETCRGADAAAAPPPRNVAEPPPERQGEAPPPPSDTAPASADSGENGDPSKPHWYGPKPGSDELAALLERQSGAEPQNLALPSGDAQTLYQQGYGALLQKDYPGAEIAFRQVVDSFPNDPLAGNAQYWLGETYFVRGEYKNAADAFLKGYKKYGRARKRPTRCSSSACRSQNLARRMRPARHSTSFEPNIRARRSVSRDEAKAWRKQGGLLT